ncbi:MAG: Uncharacterised protein [Cryomorphaceae bacterium]|nr:MAG: Uncharacterised protein [Cryomorphaceae bacterium]
MFGRCSIVVPYAAFADKQVVYPVAVRIHNRYARGVRSASFEQHAASVRLQVHAVAIGRAFVRRGTTASYHNERLFSRSQGNHSRIYVFIVAIAEDLRSISSSGIPPAWSFAGTCPDEYLLVKMFCCGSKLVHPFDQKRRLDKAGVGIFAVLEAQSIRRRLWS